jgi:hypothetical protein
VRTHRLNRCLSALLLGPLLALAVSASSFSGLRCTMSGLFMPDTGCAMLGDSAAPATDASNATLEEPACCERVVVANAKAPATSSSNPEIAPPCVHALSALILQPLAVPAPRAARQDRRSATHGRAAPVFLLTQSFLI